MSTRPFIAARIEELIDRWIEGVLRLAGWREKVICYTGYGSTRSIRVLGRVVLVPDQEAETEFDPETAGRRRGFRNFFSAACVRTPVTITVGDQVVTLVTDRGGYIDARIRNHDLAPGWQQVRVRSKGSLTEVAEVQVIGPEETFGIVSDIDDTIISTWLPRPMIAAWNSFIRDESARQAVPAMARLYQDLLAEHPGAPLIYVSTGAWNTHGFLSRFIKRHAYPAGAMLLTDWGPTNTGWFRSGMQHKADSLIELTRDFPNISWLLVGDDGQHDPAIYSRFAQLEPDRVRAIAIRQLSAAEQVLAHGTTTVLLEEQGSTPDIPWVAAPDGRGLRAGLKDLPAAVLRKRDN